MQVSNTTGMSSSATLGARAAKAVSMTQNSSLMMMLTSNLYSNQLLAAFREPLCNAWDANIEAGTTDTPLRIVLTKDNDLIIEDSGLGIHDDMMDSIYGIYGESTKANNNMVTGGFGLGSKAPWAYADSFRVISEHKGIKTVYNMPKSCVENNGDPGIIPVMSVPTERSGLTVIIPVHEDDREEIITYVQAIVKHGGMNATLEIEGEGPAEKLPVIKLGTEPGSYDVDHEDWYYDYMGNHRVFIRYGAVVYPMLKTPATQKAYELLEEFMDLVRFDSMIVQAAPGTLVLTPSREALSSQKMTEDGLVNLCTDLVSRIEEDLIAMIPSAMKDAVETLEEGTYPDFWSQCTLTRSQNPVDVIRPFALRRYLQSPMGVNLYAKYGNMLKHAEKRGFRAMYKFQDATATRHYHKLRTRLENRSYIDRRNKLRSFFYRFVMRPIGKAIAANPHMEYSGLRFVKQDYWGDYKVYSKDFWVNADFGDFQQQRQMIDTKIVFITTRLVSISDSIKLCPMVRGDKLQMWVYKINPAEKNKDSIIASLRDAGCEIVDLTLNHAWDIPAQQRLKEKAAKAKKTSNGVTPKAKKNALASLCNFYTDKNKRAIYASEAVRVADPEHTTDTPLFYLELSDFNNDGTVGKFVHYIDLTPEERMNGVLVRNGIEQRMVIHRGAVHVDKYMAPRLIDRLKTKEYQTYVTKLRQPSIQRLGIRSSDLKLFKALDIPLPGLNKLKYDANLERVYTLVKDGWPSVLINEANEIDPTGKLADEVREIIALKFEPPKFYHKVKVLKDDPMLGALASNARSDGIAYWLRHYPGRKAALRSLVLSALKDGNKS